MCVALDAVVLELQLGTPIAASSHTNQPGLNVLNVLSVLFVMTAIMMLWHSNHGAVLFAFVVVVSFGCEIVKCSFFSAWTGESRRTSSTWAVSIQEGSRRQENEKPTNIHSITFR